MANKQHSRQETMSHLIWTVQPVELVAIGLHAESQNAWDAARLSC